MVWNQRKILISFICAALLACLRDLLGTSIQSTLVEQYRFHQCKQGPWLIIRLLWMHSVLILAVDEQEYVRPRLLFASLQNTLLSLSSSSPDPSLHRNTRDILFDLASRYGTLFFGTTYDSSRRRIRHLFISILFHSDVGYHVIQNEVPVLFFCFPSCIVSRNQNRPEIRFLMVFAFAVRQRG